MHIHSNYTEKYTKKYTEYLNRTYTDKDIWYTQIYIHTNKYIKITLKIYTYTHTHRMVHQNYTEKPTQNMNR